MPSRTSEMESQALSMTGFQDALGIAAILLGAFLYLWRRKRKFDRTNEAGVERFSSFAGKIVALIVDGTLWLLTAVMLTAGILGLAHLHESTWGWMVLAPVYGFLLFGIFFTRPK